MRCKSPFDGLLIASPIQRNVDFHGGVDGHYSGVNPGSCRSKLAERSRYKRWLR